MARRTNQTTRRARRRWTADDEEVLIDEIGKNPTCMKSCFLAAAQRLDRGPAGVSNHWYKYMANREDVYARLTIGRHSCVVNRARLKPDQRPVGLFRTIFDNLITHIFGRR